jgi:hypothetical protein
LSPSFQKKSPSALYLLNTRERLFFLTGFKKSDSVDAGSSLTALSTMAAVTDVHMILRQARDGRMARAKLIEVIVAREGADHREATTAAVEEVIAFQIKKGRIISETKKGVEFLTVSR